jgi:hypothetical protein
MTMPNVDLSNVTDEQRAQIIREERDAFLLGWLDGEIADLLAAERFLNQRIAALGVSTITGDTTE